MEQSRISTADLHDVALDAAWEEFASAATPAALHVERVDGLAIVGLETAWADLCARALEPNVFLEPGFALPLLQHLCARDRPSFLLVWEENGPASFGRLVGLLPLALPSAAWQGMARGLSHEMTSCGVPLLDRDHAVAALEAAFAWLGRPQGHVEAVTFPALPRDGAFRAALREAVVSDPTRLVTLGVYERAVLRRPDLTDIASFASAKRRKERARQRRRLSECGALTYVSAKHPVEVAAAAERFLALEHAGWKGSRQTALLSQRHGATFLRTMVRLLAFEGKCRIDSIEIDGRPVAMGIVLRTGARAYFWKTAFDEAFASFSPGVQLTLDLSQRQQADRAITLTDSCAVPNHPMIDKIWPDRLAFADVLVRVRPSPGRFRLRLALEHSRRWARAKAKQVLAALRRAG